MFTIYDTKNDRFTTIEEPDPAGHYTYSDYLQWKFEDRLELFHGRIFKLCAPNAKHQAIAGNIFSAVTHFREEKNYQAFMPPFIVRLPAGNDQQDADITTVVQPDICLLCDESIKDERGCCGAPDLIIEILSPGSSHKEINVKSRLYEESGVKEYWIVFPEEESIAVYKLNEERKYSAAALYAGRQSIKSSAIEGLTINTKDIFIKNSL